MADPWKKASKSFQTELLSRAGEYTNLAASILAKASEGYLLSIEPLGGVTIPYYTGNLLDSVGVRILIGNRLADYRIMTETTYVQHATKPQHMAGQYPIWGEVEIMRRILRSSRRTGKGVVAQLMVGVPYAEEVDRTHDYFDELKDAFVKQMRGSLQVLSYYKSKQDIARRFRK